MVWQTQQDKVQGPSQVKFRAENICGFPLRELRQHFIKTKRLAQVIYQKKKKCFLNFPLEFVLAKEQEAGRSCFHYFFERMQKLGTIIQMEVIRSDWKEIKGTRVLTRALPRLLTRLFFLIGRSCTDEKLNQKKADCDWR